MGSGDLYTYGSVKLKAVRKERDSQPKLKCCMCALREKYDICERICELEGGCPLDCNCVFIEI